MRSQQISRLSDLLRNPTYSKLVQAEAVIDMKDTTFMDGPMRRSPYHLIQFLIFWATLADKDSDKALSKLNSALQEHGIDLIEKNALNALIQTINWSQILEQADTLQLKFEVPSSQKMLSTLATRYPELGTELAKRDIVENGSLDWVVGSSTFQQNSTWSKEFVETTLNGAPVWEIPADGFTLTADLLGRIKASCDDSSNLGRVEALGFFRIQYGTPDGLVKVYVAKPDRGESFLVQQPKTRVNSGLYEILNGCFLDVQMTARAVEGIQVKIEGDASFGQKGAHVKQTQTVGMFLGGGRTPERGTPTIIFVGSVEALFPQAGVPVSFYQKAVSNPLPEGVFGIRVLAKNAADVVLLPERLLPVKVASAILAADLAGSYQPADTLARGLKGEGMEYLPYPSKMEKYKAITSATTAYRGETPAEAVFVGQVPRLLPPEYIAWAFQQLINRSQQAVNNDAVDPAAIVLLWVLQTQANGCAKVWVPKDAVVNVVSKTEGNPRVFFDVSGIWIAKTPEALQKMKDHEAALLRDPVRDSRVCALSMMVEPLVRR